uniref:DNA helicase n=1 Tax=Heterorhabditis bacteriophora TaxID=37862 RepID=A0A1I7XHW4_HETBA
MLDIHIGSSVAEDPIDGVVITPDIREVEVLDHPGKRRLVVYTYLDLRHLVHPKSIDSWMLVRSLDMGIVAVFEPIYKVHVEKACTELNIGVETFDDCAPLRSFYGCVYWKATSSSRVIPIYHYEELPVSWFFNSNIVDHTLLKYFICYLFFQYSPFSFVDSGTLYGVMDGVVIMHSVNSFLIWNSIIGCVGVTINGTNVQRFPLGRWVDFTARRVSPVDDVFVLTYCYEAYEWKERNGGPKYKTIVDHVNEKVFFECNGIATTDFMDRKCVNAGELGIITRGVNDNIPSNVRGEQCIQVCCSKNGSKPELEIVKATTPSTWIDAVVVINNPETVIVSTSDSFFIIPPHVIGFYGELQLGQRLMIRTSTNSTEHSRVLEYLICGVFPDIFTENGRVKAKCRVTYRNNAKYIRDMGPMNMYCSDFFAVILDPHHIIREPILKNEYDVIIACFVLGEFTSHETFDKETTSKTAGCSMLSESDIKPEGEHRPFYTHPNQRRVHERVHNSLVMKEELVRVLVIEGYNDVRAKGTSIHVKFWIQSSDFHQRFLFVPFRNTRSFPENLSIGQWYTIDLQQLKHKKFHYSLRIKFGSQFHIPLDYPVIPKPKDMSVITIGTHYVMQILDPMPEDISEFTYIAVVEPLVQQFFDKETNSEVYWRLYKQNNIVLLHEYTKRKCEEREQEPLDWNKETASVIKKCSDRDRFYIERRKIRSKENIEMKRALKAYEDEQFAITVPKDVRLARLSACLALLRLNYAEIGRVVPEGSADKICDAEACLSASGKTKGERIREISIFLYGLLHEEKHADHIRKVSEAVYDTLVKTVLLNENYIKGAKCVDIERLKKL